MSEILRFVMIRPPQRGLPSFKRRVVGPTPSTFFLALVSARATSQPREAMVVAANAFMQTADFIDSPTKLTLATGLDSLRTALLDEDSTDLDDLDAIVTTILGQPSLTIRSTTNYSRAFSTLSDSILALTVTQTDAVLLATLSDRFRTVDFLDRLASRQDVLEIPGAVAGVLTEMTLVIPYPVYPLPPEASSGTTTGGGEPPDNQEEIDDLQRESTALADTVEHLLDFSAEDYALPTPPTSTGTSIPETQGLLLQRAVIDELPPAVEDVLAAQRIDLTQTTVAAAVSRLETQERKVRLRLRQITPTKSLQKRVRVGRSLMSAHSSIPAGLQDLKAAGPEKNMAGQVKPVGLGNLLRIKMQIKRYEGGELAHIENILKGEFKDRATRRLRRTEDTVVTAEETTREEERDLQTTDRFELQLEASKTVQEDKTFEAGASVSASYGPFFKVDANVGYSTNTSKNEAEKRAVTVAQDVTERTVARISERVRRERTTRTIEEYEESNKHGFDNKAGTQHVVGVYQWVDKVYEAQIFDYGLREFFDFVVPEPAAFLLRGLKAAHAEDLEEPEEFNLSPSALKPTNYDDYVRKYRVAGVEAPPERLKSVCRSWSGQSEGFVYSLVKSDEEVKMPSGYHPWWVQLNWDYSMWRRQDNPLYNKEEADDSPANMGIEPNGILFPSCFIGAKSFDLGEDGKVSFPMFNGRDSLPLALSIPFGRHFAMTVEVMCRPDPRMWENWRLKTHEAISTAYLKQKAEYEAKLSEAAAQAGVEIVGRSPLENRLIERAELKKQCISLVRGRNFQGFDAILEAGAGIDFSTVHHQAAHIRFFEQAFEWENMTYVFYPYYWGRKSLWQERVALQDVDPQHAEFLKAGAARVVVPVRPGFEKALAHFRNTGKVWEGGEPPMIGDEDYVEILDELKERAKAPGEEKPFGDPWEVRLPTTLVRLRAEDSLPVWTKDPQGNWLPDDGE